MTITRISPDTRRKIDRMESLRKEVDELSAEIESLKWDTLSSYESGVQAEVARALNVSRSAVGQWVKKNLAKVSK